jgi:hypothetical protein
MFATVLGVGIQHNGPVLVDTPQHAPHELSNAAAAECDYAWLHVANIQHIHSSAARAGTVSSGIHVDTPHKSQAMQASRGTAYDGVTRVACRIKSAAVAAAACFTAAAVTRAAPCGTACCCCDTRGGKWDEICCCCRVCCSC